MVRAELAEAVRLRDEEVINDEVIMTSRDVTRNQKGGRFASRGTLQKIMVGTDVLRRAWNLE
jgi:hypothetical protein